MTTKSRRCPVNRRLQTIGRAPFTSHPLGRRHGAARAWHRNGQPALEATYEGGRLTAKKEFDESGRLVLKWSQALRRAVRFAR